MIVNHRFFSYPAIVVVPCHISDDTIMKVAKNHRLSRFPVAIWRHRRTKGTLLRSGAISNKSVLTAVLRTGLTGGQAQSNHQTSDDERFYSEIGNISLQFSQFSEISPRKIAPILESYLKSETCLKQQFLLRRSIIRTPIPT